MREIRPSLCVRGLNRTSGRGGKPETRPSWFALVAMMVLCACPRSAKTDAGPMPPDAGSSPTTSIDTGSPTAASADADGEVVTVREKYIRATITLSIAAPPSKELEEACEAAFAEVERLDNVLSDWREGSELVAFNKHAGQGQVKLSFELNELLTRAYYLSQETDGAFDVTFATLGGLWSFRPDMQRVPTPEEVSARLPFVGYRHLKLNPNTQSAELDNPQTRVGIGALSDGYAASRISALLTRRGFPHHLVLTAGDGGARGRRSDRPWRLGIRDPRTGGIWGTVELHDEGIATSGNYQKSFMKDGVRYHHIIDPKSGYPSRGSSQVTVIADDAFHADGWATALFVLGPKKGLPIALKNGLEVLWFDEDFNVTGTPKMLERIQRL